MGIEKSINNPSLLFLVGMSLLVCWGRDAQAGWPRLKANCADRRTGIKLLVGALNSETPPSYKTQNTPTPLLSLGKKQRAFDSTPLQPTEVKLLERAKLPLFPHPDSISVEHPASAVSEWVHDLDAYLRWAVSHDSEVPKLIEAFVMEYVNEPATPTKQINGDGVWKIPLGAKSARHISHFSEFWKLPLFYDLQGNLLVPEAEGDLIHGKLDHLDPSDPKAMPSKTNLLWRQVYTNLQKVQFDQFAELLENGAYKTREDIFQQASYLRRLYLTISLLNHAEELIPKP